MSLISNNLEIIVWDVQHGNAIFIKTPNGINIVLDLGTGSHKNNNELFSPLLYLKNNWGINYIDLLIITHPDLDHIEDIVNLDQFKVNCLIRSYGLSAEDIKEKMENAINNTQREIFRKYLNLMERYTASVPYENSPLNPQKNGGVEIKIHRPEPEIKSNIANNYSIVSIISYASSKIIIPGDNEPPSWKWLLEKEEFKEDIKNTDIFFASHHGRKSGYYNDLFNYFKPKLVVISDGHICDTNATDRYYPHCEGWKIHRRSGNSLERKCLTTRNDGVIHIKMGYNGKNPFLEVKIN
ncbi:MAG: ComEC/Rec2 family competence protein [Candidatus Helarchaeota archaeon]